MYTFENLKEDVAREAQALKVHATKEELERLDFSKLQTDNPIQCVYGQIAFGCFSDRASELIFTCCQRYFKVWNRDTTIHELAGKRGFYEFANGQTINGVNDSKSLLEQRLVIKGGYYSAIEAYILLPEAKNADLIAYLKGEVETLEL
jgi:hypothetical protein